MAPTRPRFRPALVVLGVAALSSLVSCRGAADRAADPAPVTVAASGTLRAGGTAATTAEGAGGGSGVGTTSSSSSSPAEVRVRIRQLARFDQPVALAVRPGDPRPGRLYVAEQGGRVLALDRDGAVAATPVLDVRARTRADGEQGLLGLAFSADGTRLYVNYTDRDGDTNIDEFTLTPSGQADPASRRRVLLVDQPYRNHNGGHLVTGPDGMLYVGMGDGGSGGDPLGNGQDLGTLLGKLLRIDPTAGAGSPYRVPADNPFVGVAGARPEIWAYGLRNPWGFSFDPATGDLWIADVGQDAIEEVNVARAADGRGRGVNFGWNAFEGSARFDRSVSAPDAVAPRYEYRHGDAADEGCSVTGGVVYRQTRIAGLAGTYLFADYCVAGIRALSAAPGDGPVSARQLLDQPARVVAFALDADGEVIVATGDGAVSRLEPRS